jgi:transketolase
MNYKKKSEKLAQLIREQTLIMCHEAKAAHVASSLSIIDLISVLYENILKLTPSSFNKNNRNYFILSKGHASAAIYSLLAIKNFFPLKLLKTFGKKDSILMSHVNHRVPGIELSTGSLGHGLSFGSGVAMFYKKNKIKKNIYVLLSDGELNEGSNWESFMFCAHHKLSNLCAIIDYNRLQSLSSVKNTLGLEPLKEKFLSFGWKVIEIDGHNHDLILKSLKAKTKKPKVIIANTIKGKGVSFMENKVKWHYSSPIKIELEKALHQIRNK